MLNCRNKLAWIAGMCCSVNFCKFCSHVSKLNHWRCRKLAVSTSSVLLQSPMRLYWSLKPRNRMCRGTQLVKTEGEPSPSTTVMLALIMFLLFVVIIVCLTRDRMNSSALLSWTHSCLWLISPNGSVVRKAANSSWMFRYCSIHLPIAIPSHKHGNYTKL